MIVLSVSESARPGPSSSSSGAVYDGMGASAADVKKQCEEKAPNGLGHGEIIWTQSGDLSCKAIYHGYLPKFEHPDSASQVNDLTLIIPLSTCMLSFLFV